MLLHRILRPRNILIAIALLILHNEYLVYVAVRLFVWHQIHCQPSSVSNCTRLLLVADPQILGVTLDTNGYNAIAIFDSDRFLRATYAQAFAHSRPHAVAFLGDLMDEGSIATNEQYERYTQRFRRIYGEFTTQNAHTDGTHRGSVDDDDYVQVLHIAGDNDIGGETSTDIVTDAKVARFRRHFHDVGHIDVRNRTRVVNVNLLTRSIPDVSVTTTPAHMARVIVSHMSLLAYPGLTSERITNAIRPDVVFSAHLHISRTVTYPPMHLQPFDTSVVQQFTLREPSAGHQHTFNYREIAVPTCSYRMGVARSGFGLAVIENNQLSYTVLWLPNRFTMLYSYLAVIVTIAVLLIIRRCIVAPAHHHHLGHITYKRLSSV